MANSLPKSRAMHGARALVYASISPQVPGNTGTGSGTVPSTSDALTLIGIFTSVSWSFSYQEADVDILGRFGPADIVYTGASTVSGSASGWRYIDSGPFATGLFPTLNQLLNYDSLTFSIVDRQDPTKVLCQISGVKPLNYSSGVANKTMSTFSIDFKGLLIEEDSIINVENNVPQLPT